MKLSYCFFVFAGLLSLSGRAEEVLFPSTPLDLGTSRAYDSNDAIELGIQFLSEEEKKTQALAEPESLVRFTSPTAWVPYEATEGGDLGSESNIFASTVPKEDRSDLKFSLFGIGLNPTEYTPYKSTVPSLYQGLKDLQMGISTTE